MDIDADMEVDGFVADLIETTPVEDVSPTDSHNELMDLDDILSETTLIPVAKPTSDAKLPTRKVPVPRPAALVPSSIAPTQSPTTTSTTIPNISQSAKPILTTASGQQIVIMQKPSGAMPQIRISNVVATPTTSPASGPATPTTTTSNIQLIKKADGSFIQIMNGKLGASSTAVIANATSATATQIANPKAANANGSTAQYVIKNGVNKRVMIANMPSVKLPANSIKIAAPSASTNSGGATVKQGPSPSSSHALVPAALQSGTPRTLTVAQAQKMGLLSSAKLKELVSQATAQKQAKAQASVTAAEITPKTTASEPSTTTHTSAINHTPPVVRPTPPLPVPVTKSFASTTPSANASSTALGGGPTKKSPPMGGNQKILIQTAEGVQKQVLLPPHLYKLAQEGKIKAVSIAGKGIQYVRVNTPNTNRVGASGVPSGTSSESVTTMSGAMSNLSVVKMPALTPAPAVRTTAQVMHASSRMPLLTMAGQQRPVKTRIPYATTSNNTPSTSSHQPNRSIRMLETIDPDTLLCRSSITTIDPSAGTRKSTSSLAARHQKSADSFQKKVEAYLGEYTGDGFVAPIVPSSSKSVAPSVATSSETDQEGPRRKHCNCTKSQCLKLYCDCFANGEFCQNCNCKDCFNNIDFEEDRHKAIKMCLERNPHAFKPKIGKGKDTSDTLRRHTKGCNCKRSGCLKNYCECYEAKIVCSENCKCIDCHNMNEFTNVYNLDKSFNEFSNIASTVGLQLNHSNHNHHTTSTTSLNNSNAATNHTIHESPFPKTSGIEFEKAVSYAPVAAVGPSGADRIVGQKRADRSESPEIPPKVPCNFMTQDVIEATIQCLVAQAEECQRNNLDTKASERLILEEFGRCLVEIIDFSSNNPNE